MANVFIDYETKICAPWLNTVDTAVNDALGHPTTPTEARINIGAASQTEVDNTNAAQDANIALKADITYVDNQNATQDAAIALKVDQTYVDNQNATQDVVIASKADTTYVDTENNAQDITIALKADKTYVDTENDIQDTAIALKADISYVDAKVSFGTIAVSGQSNVVADTPLDTITLAAGANISLATNAATDTITITGAGASGVPDGDKGDIVVSGSGSTWTLDSSVVTAAARTVVDDTTVGAMVDTLGGAASTGTGGLVRATSPTLVTPALGTPASGNLVNCSGIADTGKNRIINGDFRINQRGVSGTVTLAAWAYGHDRWQAMGSGCTYTFASVNGLTTITITAGTLRQVIEDVNFPPGTNPCTLSWTGTAQGAIDVAASGTSPRTATLTGGNHKYVSFTTGTVANVQLEIGSIATPFTPRLYTIEEMLCKRYYQRLGGYSDNDIRLEGYAAFAGGAITQSFSFPVSMRIAPAVTRIGTWGVFNCGQPTILGASAVGFSMGLAATASGGLAATTVVGAYWACNAEL